MQFKVIKKDKKTKARVGILETPHGSVETPAFIPVATQATIKGLSSDEMKDLGAQIMICNTYHLMLRPGADLVKKMGGLHKFMNWGGTLMTDSGGFQAFSLGFGMTDKVGKVLRQDQNKLVNADIFGKNKLARITEEGVKFNSHLDGSLHNLTPEYSMEIQNKLGADLIYVLDECTSPLADYDYTKKSIERTLRWAKRSQEAHQNKNQTLFGIVQGGVYPDLRKKSAKDIAGLGFEGFGIGGSFGEKQMPKIVRAVNEILPEDKPRHLLGIGEVEDIILAIEQGVDMFDCVTPTRYGRHGLALTSEGKVNLFLAKFRQDKRTLDKNCDCWVCKTYTRAYLAHLLRAGEINGLRFLTYHNLSFMINLFVSIRDAISKGQYNNFKKKLLKKWQIQ